MCTKGLHRPNERDGPNKHTNTLHHTCRFLRSRFSFPVSSTRARRGEGRRAPKHSELPNPSRHGQPPQIRHAISREQCAPPLRASTAHQRAEAESYRKGDTLFWRRHGAFCQFLQEFSCPKLPPCAAAGWRRSLFTHSRPMEEMPAAPSHRRRAGLLAVGPLGSYHRCRLK